MADDCTTVLLPPIPAQKDVRNEFKFRYDLGQVVDGGVAPVDICYYSTGGYGGEEFVLCGNLVRECIMCKEII